MLVAVRSALMLAASRVAARAGRRREEAYGEVQLAMAAAVAPKIPGWSYELKYHGYRILALKSGSETRLLSRNRRDWTADFRAIASAVAEVKSRNCILDGEICALKEDGSSSFQSLCNRTPRTRLTYFVFDCLLFDGMDVRTEPIETRRALVQRLSVSWEPDGSLRPSPVLSSDPNEMLTRAREQKLEGIVAKAAASPYVGGRSGLWVKIKCGRRQEFAVLGWLPHSRLGSAIGSLLIGVKGPDGRFQVTGKVGTGFSAENRRTLFELLRKDESPFRPEGDLGSLLASARFVVPRHVAEVAFLEWGADGYPRHPSFVGLRLDKLPEECVREEPEPTTFRHPASGRAEGKRASCSRGPT